MELLDEFTVKFLKGSRVGLMKEIFVECLVGFLVELFVIFPVQLLEKFLVKLLLVFLVRSWKNSWWNFRKFSKNAQEGFLVTMEFPGEISRGTSSGTSKGTLVELLYKFRMELQE